MIKYSNGQYIEMTQEEMEEFENCVVDPTIPEVDAVTKFAMAMRDNADSIEQLREAARVFLESTEASTNE